MDALKRVGTDSAIDDVNDSKSQAGYCRNWKGRIELWATQKTLFGNWNWKEDIHKGSHGTRARGTHFCFTGYKGVNKTAILV